MDGLIELAAFAGIMALAQFSPGPDMLLLTRTALAEGRAAGVRMALGIASGLALHATLAVGGVSLAVRQSAGVRTALAWLGAAYLGWLAWRLAREAFAPASGRAPAVRPGHAYLRGLMCNLLNPKVVVALAAILVPFLGDPGQRPAWWRPALWAVIVGQAALLWSLWACLLQVDRLRRAYERAKRGIDLLFAAVLAGLALWLVVGLG